MKKINVYNIFIVFSIIISCICLPFKYMQNDTFYIIKVGQYISKYGIDLIDHYCWVDTLTYTYPHWLYDIYLYFIYNFFGFVGVYISIIIGFIFIIFTIYYVNYNMHHNKLLSFIVSIISCYIICTFIVARSQIISLPLFILEVYFINKLCDTGKNKYIIYLCIISLLIANIHATIWLFVFILFLPFIVEEIIFRIINNKNIKKLYKLDKYKDSKIIVNRNIYFNKIIMSFILCFIMGFFSPSKICYTYVIKIMMGNSQNLISEHFPLVITEHYFFIFLLFIFVLLLSLSKIKIYLRELFMIIGLTFMSFMSIRHLIFFYSIGFLYIVVISNRYLNNINDKTFYTLEYYIKNKRLVRILILLFITSYSLYRFYGHIDEKFVYKKEYPVYAVEYIKNNLDYKNIRLFNEYNYGSYLLFNDIPVFIDSRCDLYLKEFNSNINIFNDYFYITNYLDYEKYFKKYNINYVLIGNNSNLYMILNIDTNYNSIYSDKYFTIFERS